MKKAIAFTTPMALCLAVSMVISSCMPGTGSLRSKSNAKNNLASPNSKNTNIGSGAIGSDGTTNPDGTLISQKIELSHLVDPFDGTYKKKLTIPKNFKGNLYLAGLNVAALTNKLVSVRFNFGVEKQAVTLTATVARAPGIVPKTDIQVLVIDMNSRPFNRMRLGYDLYDYNDYGTDPSAPSKEIVSDPRDGGLYCRGLKLEDDPTFTALNNSSTCSGTDDKCLYSYAKIVDSTLYSSQTVNGSPYILSSIPTRIQSWTDSGTGRTPSISNLSSSACLPDDNDLSSLQYLFNISNAILPIFPTYNTEIMTGQFYRGPYRSLNDSEWQISSNAIYSAKNYGLFLKPFVGSTTGFQSLLFPRAGKLSLGQGLSYLGSSPNFSGARSVLSSDSTGTTSYVDGCNLRAVNYDPSANEGMSSCNVNASIEVFYMVDGKEVSITTDKTIKLQLIRPSLTNSEGKEVLTTAFKHCESSSTCGSSECCFNSRCWSKDLVTQCVEQTPVIGNQEVGANCKSDYECSSLCCNQSTGSCSPFNPNGTTPAFCRKSAGQQCVSKEFCDQVAVVTCKIVKSGINPDGTQACTLRCPAVMTYGNCAGGTCVPPVQPAVPAFDPKDCSQAVDP